MTQRQVDCSLMVPPEPMQVVLEQLEAMEVGDTLLMTHRHRPSGLFPVLLDRGFEHQFKVEQEGHIELLIWKKACITD